MTFVRYLLMTCLGSLLCASLGNAQQPASSQSSAVVPRLVTFSGKATEAEGKAIFGVASATFAIYKDQHGGAPLWLETQNVDADKDGNYTAQLGATKSEGLPLELFSTAEPRWLGVRINGGDEQPRVLLISVPYALKAADAETLGGKPLSAFQLAPEFNGSVSHNATSNGPQAPAAEQANEIVCSSGTACNIGFIPLFSNNGGSATVSNSLVRQSGSTVSLSANEALSGNLSMANSTGTAGNILKGGLLFLSNFGFNTFLGQNAGNLTMSGNNNTAAGANALPANTTGCCNTATGNNALLHNTTGGGNTASGDGALFSNSTGSSNTAIGRWALISNTTGNNNTALGVTALRFNTTGIDNTASGFNALSSNTTGFANTAGGVGALFANSTGSENTANGFGALGSNTTGSNDTASGSGALGFNTTGSNSTASGFQALAGNTTGSNNTASGSLALNSNSTGSDNTASGFNALSSNTTGFENTASGVSALQSNTTGVENTAIGKFALQSNTTGSTNTASGFRALQSNNTGGDNTANGMGALLRNTTGFANSASGFGALGLNTIGGFNTAIGFQAGINLTGSNNIDIGNQGVGSDSGVIRIGTVGTQTQTFIAGISGVTTGGKGAAVLVDSNGQLGTVSSSRRLKYDIQDMGEASGDLLKLRPVTFRYKQAQDDGSHPLQYGLIAEEVADVYPGLVQFDKGEPQTVLYHVLPAMLLNEVQKQQREIEALEKLIQSQQEQLKAQEERLRRLEPSLLSKGN